MGGGEREVVREVRDGGEGGRAGVGGLGWGSTYDTGAMNAL